MLSAILTLLRLEKSFHDLADEAKARYYPRRKPKDGKINWDRSDKEIYNLIRALVAPWLELGIGTTMKK